MRTLTPVRPHRRISKRGRIYPVRVYYRRPPHQRR